MRFAPLLLLLFASPVLGQADLRTQAETVLLAAKDAAKFPASVAKYLRYLDMASVPVKEREDAYLVLCGHMQHLSRSSDIVRPALVNGTVGGLLRINLEDYGISLQVWEQLAEQDPYYHVQAVEQTPVYYPGGVASDGKYYAKGTYYKAGKLKAALAPWLVPTEEHKAALAYLVGQTGSQVPIVNGAWFFNQTAAAVDRKPNYYDFLGVKDQKTFEKVIGFDRKLFEGFSIELRASVALSGVTLQPRAIARRAALGGGYWTTYDFRLAKGTANPLTILGKDIEREFDAAEVFGQLANGFWATGLFDIQGKLQDSAPDFIASDGMSKSNDRRVHVNVSCIRCHFEGGMKPLEDWTRNLLTPPPPLALQSYDYKELAKLRQQYLKKLEPFIDRDRLTYEQSVKEATGWTAKEYAAKYSWYWERFEDAKVNLAWVERDIGVPREQLKLAVGKYLGGYVGAESLILAAFLKENGAVPLRQYLEQYAAIQAAIQAVK